MASKKLLWGLGALNILVLVLIIFPITRSKNADAQTCAAPVALIACTDNVILPANCTRESGVVFTCSGGHIVSVAPVNNALNCSGSTDSGGGDGDS